MLLVSLPATVALGTNYYFIYKIYEALILLLFFLNVIFRRFRSYNIGRPKSQQSTLSFITNLAYKVNPYGRCDATKVVRRLQTHNTSKTTQVNFAPSSPPHLLQFVCRSSSLALLRRLIMSHPWKHGCHKPYLQPESKVNTASAAPSLGLPCTHFSPDVSYSTRARENKRLKAEEEKL